MEKRTQYIVGIVLGVTAIIILWNIFSGSKSATPNGGRQTQQPALPDCNCGFDVALNQYTTICGSTQKCKPKMPNAI